MCTLPPLCRAEGASVDRPLRLRDPHKLNPMKRSPILTILRRKLSVCALVHPLVPFQLFRCHPARHDGMSAGSSKAVTARAPIAHDKKIHAIYSYIKGEGVFSHVCAACAE